MDRGDRMNLAIQSITRAEIEAMLSQGHTQKSAAALLGCSSTTLRKRMTSLGMPQIRMQYKKNDRIHKWFDEQMARAKAIIPVGTKVECTSDGRNDYVRKRQGKVAELYPHYFIVKFNAGYRECFQYHDLFTKEVKVIHGIG
jgi:uncharacterized protein Veg